jgi:hypothetical protein
VERSERLIHAWISPEGDAARAVAADPGARYVSPLPVPQWHTLLGSSRLSITPPKQSLHLDHVVLVVDRGIITQTLITEDFKSSP